MLKVDLAGARTGLLFAYWNMEVAHDNKKKSRADVDSNGVGWVVT